MILAAAQTKPKYKDIRSLIKNLSPKLNNGDYVFCTIAEGSKLENIEVIATFNEKEEKTLILKKEIADRLNLNYQTVMSWITLNVYSFFT